MKWLHVFNCVGVAALSVLCVFQWKINRELNLRAEGLEKDRVKLTATQKELEGNIKGLAADLDDFRNRHSAHTEELASLRKNLKQTENEADNLIRQRDQLKENAAVWSNAVKLRDERLQEANTTITSLSEQLKASIQKQNEIVQKHNEVVDKYNSLASSITNAAPRSEKAQ